ncbi:hypothetical protein V8E51_006098 [Hyaloscypha variabilis]
MGLDDEALKDGSNLRPDNPQPDSQHIKHLPPIRKDQAKDLNKPTSSLPNKQSMMPQSWQQQGFATYSAQHKFTTGLSRISKLATRYPKQAPHLQNFRRCLERLSLSLDSRRFGVDQEGVDSDNDIDVEKTRVWKFRFLDLMIGMLLNEDMMTDKEIGNVLVYAETAMKEFRESLGVKGKENAWR